MALLNHISIKSLRASAFTFASYVNRCVLNALLLYLRALYFFVLLCDDVVLVYVHVVDLQARHVRTRPVLHICQPRSERTTHPSLGMRRINDKVRCRHHSCVDLSFQGAWCLFRHGASPTPVSSLVEGHWEAIE